MRRQQLTLTLAACTLGLVTIACSGDSKNETNAAPSLGDQAKAMADKGVDKGKEIAAAAEKKFNELKDEYSKKSDTKMSSFDATVADLKAKAASLSGDAKVEYEKLLVQIKDKREEAHKALVDLKSKGETAFDGAKTSVETKFAELQTLIERAKSEAK